ncbi:MULTISPECIES: LysR family transcriptional regulator [unclassified Microbacterium]|uniref:LysR family transcriptional regulator n=1 Tax=unclassified Microbacterium TaxID=2609290 RepID=UPI000C2C0E65|nr:MULTISPECIES: LysR family transcriptional regulator [unclassified Microbacterium]
MPDLDLLHTFVVVHRAGSFTAAATRLGLSQPAVSDRIARLEADLGTSLFIRSVSGSVATSAGEALVLKVAAAVDRLQDAWTAPPSGLDSTVRVGGASDVVAARVIPTLAPLTADGIRLEFTLGLAEDLLNQLAQGALDIVVSSVRKPMKGIRYRGLVDEEFVLVGAPSLARSIDRDHLATDPATALQHLPLVAYDADLSIVRRYWRSQFGHRPTNSLALIVPDLRGVLTAVVAGAGISALPRYLADAAIGAGSVEVLHRPGERPINTLHLAIAAATPLTAPTTRVIDGLVERARDWDVF